MSLAHASLTPVLQEILQRLIMTYQPERIYLFGSKARSGTVTFQRQG
jgi:hypothetical protein